MFIFITGKRKTVHYSLLMCARVHVCVCERERDRERQRERVCVYCMCNHLHCSDVRRHPSARFVSIVSSSQAHRCPHPLQMHQQKAWHVAGACDNRQGTLLRHTPEHSGAAWRSESQGVLIWLIGERVMFIGTQFSNLYTLLIRLMEGNEAISVFVDLKN